MEEEDDDENEGGHDFLGCSA